MAKITLCVSAVLVLAGCSATYKIEQRPAVGELNKYTSVHVETVQVDAYYEENPNVRDEEKFSEWRDEIQTAQTQIATQLLSYLTKYYQLASEPKEGSFTVKTELKEFDPGRAMGTNSSTSSITVIASLVDSESGTVLGKASVVGRVTVGSRSDAYKQCARGIARFVFDHYVVPEKKKPEEKKSEEKDK